MCKYEFKDTSKCKEEAFENSEYCILHMKGPAVRSPEDRRSEEYKRINGLKNAKVKEKISKSDFNFDGAKLYYVHIKEVDTKTNIEFNNAIHEALQSGWDPDDIRNEFYNNTLNYKNNTLYFNNTFIENIYIDNSNIGGELLFG
ncbi:MAG: hypothetical protein HWN67_16795 [Candidatus Helarchaeota archaeon]|nr:hypothetical protein [Candidatus Helarchaeota archaeon]